MKGGTARRGRHRPGKLFPLFSSGRLCERRRRRPSHLRHPVHPVNPVSCRFPDRSRCRPVAMGLGARNGKRQDGQD